MRATFGEVGLEYEGGKKIIVCDQMSKTYTANNKSGGTVALYKIDGAMITSGSKCDYGLCVYNRKKLYLIELKGNKYSHACRQIFETHSKLKSKIVALQADVYARIVLTRVPIPNTMSHNSNYRNLEAAIGRNKIAMKSGGHMQENV